MTETIATAESAPGASSGGKSLSYEEQKHLARHDNPMVRANLAGRTDTRREVLYYLAEDQSAEVRQTIAANQETPPKANLLLAQDQDASVRCELAAKLSAIVPGLSPDGHLRLREQTFEVLEVLVRDQLPRVREILAESLKDVANAPPNMIRQLARDEAFNVAGPVLRYSPLLSDDDLVEIIRTTSTPGKREVISQRASLSALVSDAIVGSDDARAITVLLGNHSAQIREETLDRIIERAQDREEWHGPLARRPQLSRGAMCRIACFVGDSLLETLRARDDFDPEMMEAVGAEMRRRLSAARAACPEGETPGVEESDTKHAMSVALERARSMAAADQLTEDDVVDAIDEGDRTFATAALAVRAGLAIAVVVSWSQKIGQLAKVYSAG